LIAEKSRNREASLMRILITGASGLLGLNLALEAARSGHEVYGVVHNHSLRTAAFQTIVSDLLAPGALERILDQARPDWVIHCAALAVVDACEADPGLAAKLNTDLPAQLARHVARGGARLVHLSTDAVFDGQRGDYTETDAPNPLSVYARTKLDGERAVAEANPQAIIARVNLYGWSLSGKRSLAEFFFYNLQAEKPVQGFTDVYFCPLLANDLAHILIKMCAAGLSGLYHAVCSQGLTKYDFGRALARRFGFAESLIAPVSVEQGGLKAARSPRLTLRTEKLAEALGEPLPPFPPGLERFYTLYQQGYPQRLFGMRSTADA
jgi:dTDP-4-dehydrorhamnose reductase